MIHRILPVLVLALAGATSALGQFTWTNSDGDFAFSTPANWTPNGIPLDGDDLVIGSDEALGFDHGGNFLAGGITIAAGVSATLGAFGVETLTIGTGGLTNLGFGATFDLPVLTAGLQSWSLGDGALTFNLPFAITSDALTINLGSGSSITFASFDPQPEWDGALNFTGTLAPLSIFVGDTLTTDHLALITLNGSGAGVTEDGYLTAIPEPATTAAWLGAATLLALGLRRRSRLPVRGQ